MRTHEHIENVPFIDGVQDLTKYLDPLYIIEDYMVDEDTYTEFFETLYDVIKGCFVIEECRKYPVKFKFYRTDTEEYTMEFRHFIINLILWRPFILLSSLKIMDEEMIMDCTKIIVDRDYDLDTFMNERIIRVLREYNVKGKLIDKSISQTNYNLIRISIDFEDIMNVNFSFFTFWHMYRDIPRVREIMETTFPDKSEPREVELQIDKLQDELVKLIKDDPNNPIGLILKARTGIKTKQLVEFMIAQSYKPTIDGNIMTIPIENSTLIRGLDRPSYLFIDASAARKSLILNKTVMGNAGNFGKLALQLNKSLTLSLTVSDCDTKHPGHVLIRSKDHLKKLNGRFYRLNSNEDYRLIDAKKDKDLVGQVIEYRTPATCSLGDCVCQKCFGWSGAINYELSEGLPAFETEEATKELEQNVLSSKHIMTTESEKIIFNDTFYKYFTLYAGEIYPNVIDNDDIKDPEKLAIWIDPNSIAKADDMDEDSQYNTYIETGTFYVVNLETHEREVIQMENPKEMFLSDFVVSYWRNSRKKDGFIPFSDLDNDTEIVSMNILNNELTRPLYEIMKLMNTSKHGITDIDEMLQRALDLIVESGMHASALSLECTINRVIRSVENIYERPDFSSDYLEPYTIKSINYCLEKNKSVTLGLATQYLRRQMTSDEFVTTRTGTSFMDPFMKIEVPNLFERYANIIDDDDD